MARVVTWTAKELDCLRSHYATATRASLCGLLPGRPWGGIKKKALVLRLTRTWTVREEYAHLSVLDESAKAWLAAALDFEGTIGISRHHEGYDAYISISNTNVALIEHFKAMLRLKTVGHHRIDSRVPRRKPIHQLSCSRMPFLVALLTAILPYIVAKKEQALLVIEFIRIQDQKGYAIKSIYSERQVEIYKRIRLFNRRGM